jgi:phage/plasmid-associated DNA primase
MLSLRTTSDEDDRDTMKEMYVNYPEVLDELNNFVPKNLPAYRMKLTFPEGFRMDCDLDGIHFINGRFDVRTGEFSQRGFPDFSRPETFVTNYISHLYEPPSKSLCDEVFDRLLKSFGSREKLEFCLAYAGAALNGRSSASSCSCKFHVGVGGSGKNTFVDWIKAAVTNIYYKDLQYLR